MNLTFKRLLLYFIFLPLCIQAQEMRTVCIPKGTNVSIRIIETINSQEAHKKKTAPQAVVSGDVWDANGEIILIKGGTPVSVQMKSKRATCVGDVGSVEIQPISTVAYNGRLITFDGERPIIFKGNEDAVFTSQKKVIVVAGTPLIATISNDYCFKIP